MLPRQKKMQMKTLSLMLKLSMRKIVQIYPWIKKLNPNQNREMKDFGWNELTKNELQIDSALLWLRYVCVCLSSKNIFVVCLQNPRINAIDKILIMSLALRVVCESFICILVYICYFFFFFFMLMIPFFYILNSFSINVNV